MKSDRRPRVVSLRLRLLLATLAAVAVALLLAGLLLAGLFKGHVLRQFGNTLTAQLDQLTAQLEFDAQGRPQINAASLTDPRWSKPYSGLYWQLDDMQDIASQRGRLRSRSLWDATLSVANDSLADGVVHVHQATGPSGSRLMLVERTVKRDDQAAAAWRLVVAADLRETEAAVARFNGVLAASLAVLLALLGAAAIAQVAIGLAPLRALERALMAVHQGRAQRLGGRFPVELQPLIDDFNAVLDRNADVVSRARTQAGNLAHAIKTPLAAIDQAAQSALRHPQPADELAQLVAEQVAAARRQVDWHLARSRAAAALGVPGLHAKVAPVVAGLLRVMAHVHEARGLALDCAPIEPDLCFAGELQDLHEILGNLLDNACKWARREVHVSAQGNAAQDGSSLLQIVVADDGPGIDPARYAAVLARGARLDETTPGSGLGLAIVHDLVELYGGTIELGSSEAGGLRVVLTLPGVV